MPKQNKKKKTSENRPCKTLVIKIPILCVWINTLSPDHHTEGTLLEHVGEAPQLKGKTYNKSLKE